MTGPQFDPERWPLAPGNASPQTEAKFAALAEAWPPDTTAVRELVNGIISRPDRRGAAA